MTPKTEEDVMKAMGKIERFIEEWDARKDTLASVESVQTVNKKIDSHIEHHRWSVGTVIAALGGTIGFISFIDKFVGKGKTP